MFGKPESRVLTLNQAGGAICAKAKNAIQRSEPASGWWVQAEFLRSDSLQKWHPGEKLKSVGHGSQGISLKCPGLEAQSRCRATEQPLGIQDQNQGAPTAREEADPAMIFLSRWGFSRHLFLGLMDLSSGCVRRCLKLWASRNSKNGVTRTPRNLLPWFPSFPSPEPPDDVKRKCFQVHCHCTGVLCQPRDRKWRITFSKFFVA